MDWLLVQLGPANPPQRAIGRQGRGSNSHLTVTVPVRLGRMSVMTLGDDPGGSAGAPVPEAARQLRFGPQAGSRRAERRLR